VRHVGRVWPVPHQFELAGGQDKIARGEKQMPDLKNRQWLLAARPVGMIKDSDYRWNETAVPALKDGEVLLRNLAFSFDPTQRGWMSMDTYVPAIPIGADASRGGQSNRRIEEERLRQG
jgi:NADPH-dependent curcumin reductase CurA